MRGWGIEVQEGQGLPAGETSNQAVSAGRAGGTAASGEAGAPVPAGTNHAPYRAMGRADWSLILILALLWGASFFFAKVALSELPPLTLVLGRVSLAAVALNLVIAARGRRMPKDLDLWKSFFIMGMLNNALPFSLLFWGTARISSGLASIMNATTPLFTVVLAHFLTRDEKLTGLKLAGVAAGMGGVAVMIGVDALRGLGSNIPAQLACIAAAGLYGLSGIYARRFHGLPPTVTATGQLTCSTAVILPLALLVERPWSLPPPGPATWGAVAGLAFLSTVAAYMIFFRLVAATGATNTMQVTFLIPVSALLLSVTVLKEPIFPYQLAGLAVIVIGLACVDGRLFKLIKHRARRFFSDRSMHS